MFCVSVAVSRIEPCCGSGSRRCRGGASVSSAVDRGLRRVDRAQRRPTATVIVRRKRWPKSRSCPVVSGTKTTSSWSVPLGDAPRARHHADDLERHVVDQRCTGRPDRRRRGTASSRRSGRARPPPRSSSTSVLVKKVPRATGQLRAHGKSRRRRRHAGLIVDVAEAHGRRAAAARAPRRSTLGSASIASASAGVSVATVPPMPARVAALRPDQQQVGAHRADAVEHALLGAVADGEHRDHRGDADDDAEQRQHGAEEVRLQRSAPPCAALRRARRTAPRVRPRRARDASAAFRRRARWSLRRRCRSTIWPSLISITRCACAATFGVVGDEDDGVAFARELLRAAPSPRRRSCCRARRSARRPG